MALEISYWTGTDALTRQVYGEFISAETRSLSGTSAQSGATPDNAAFVRVEATEAARVHYGTNPTAADGSLYLGSGGWIEFAAVAGNKIAGKTA